MSAMGGALGDARGTISVDTGPAGKGLDQLGKKLQGLDRTSRGFGSGFDHALGDISSSASRAAGRIRSIFGGLNMNVSPTISVDTGPAARAVGIVESEFRNLNSAGLQIDDGFTTAASQMVATAEQTAGRIRGSLGSAMSTGLGFIGAQVATQIAGGIGGAVNDALDYSGALANVNSIAQLTTPQLAALNQQVLDLANDPRVLDTPTELANGLYDIYSSGFQGADGLNVLTAASIAATAGLTTTETSGRAISAVLNAYGLDASHAQEVSDYLFQTVNSGVVTFDQLANNMGSVLPIASTLGVGIDQVGAAYASLTLQSYSVSEAETGVANILRAALNPTDELTAAVQAHGYASAEAAFQSEGLGGFLNILEDASGGTAAGMNELLGTSEATSAAIALLNEDGSGYVDMLGDMEGATDGAGATQAALAKQMESASFKVEKAKQALQTMATMVLGLFMPAIGAAAGLVTKFAGKIQKGVDKITSFGKYLKAAFGPNGDGDYLNDFLMDIPKPLRGLALALGKTVNQIGDKVNLLKTTFRNLKLIGVDPVDAAFRALRITFPALIGPINQVEGVVKNLIGRWDMLTSSFRGFRTFGMDPVSAGLAALGNAFPSLRRVTDPLRDAVAELTAGFDAGGLGGALATIPGLVRDAVVGLAGMTIDFAGWSLTVAFPAVIDFVGDLFGGIRTWIEGRLGIGPAGQIAAANRGESFAPLTWQGWALGIGAATISWAWDALTSIYAWIKVHLGVTSGIQQIGAQKGAGPSGAVEWGHWALAILGPVMSWAWDGIAAIYRWIKQHLGVTSGIQQIGAQKGAGPNGAVEWGGWALSIMGPAISWAWDAITGIYNWIKIRLGVGGIGAIGAQKTGGSTNDAVEWGKWALSITGPAISWAWDAITGIYSWIKSRLGIGGNGLQRIGAQKGAGPSGAVEWGGWALSILGPVVRWGVNIFTTVYDWIKNQLGVNGGIRGIGAQKTGGFTLADWWLTVAAPKLEKAADFINTIVTTALNWVQDALESINQDDLQSAMYTFGATLERAFSGSMDDAVLNPKGGTTGGMADQLATIIGLIFETAGNIVGPALAGLLFGDFTTSLDTLKTEVDKKVGQLLAGIIEKINMLRNAVGDGVFDFLFGDGASQALDDGAVYADMLQGITVQMRALRDAHDDARDAFREAWLNGEGNTTTPGMHSGGDPATPDGVGGPVRHNMPNAYDIANAGDRRPTTGEGADDSPNLPSGTRDQPQFTGDGTANAPKPPPYTGPIPGLTPSVPRHAIHQTPENATSYGDPATGGQPMPGIEHSTPVLGGGHYMAAGEAVNDMLKKMQEGRTQIAAVARSIGSISVPSPNPGAFRKGVAELPPAVTNAARAIGGTSMGALKAPETSAARTAIKALPTSVTDLAGRIGGIATGSVKAPQTTGFTGAVKLLPTSVTALAQTIAGTKMGSIQKPETSGFATAIDGLKTKLSSLKTSASEAGAAAAAALTGGGNTPPPQKGQTAAPAAPQAATPNFGPAIAAAAAAKSAIAGANSVIQSGVQATSNTVITQLGAVLTSGLPPVTQLSAQSQLQFATMNTVNSVAVRTLQGAVGTSFGTIQADGGAKVTGLNATVVGQFAAMQGGASGAASGMEGSVGGSMTGMQGKSIGAANATNTGVVGQLNTMAGGGGTAAGRLVTSVVGTIQGGAGAASSAGYSLGAAASQGVAAGINAYLSEITGAANRIVAEVQRAVSAGLAIHSPSQWMRDEVGKNITAGIAVGITQTTGTVVRAMDDVTARVKAAADFMANYLARGGGGSSGLFGFGIANDAAVAKMTPAQLAMMQQAETLQEIYENARDGTRLADDTLAKLQEIARILRTQGVDASVAEDGSLIANAGAYWGKSIEKAIGGTTSGSGAGSGGLTDAQRAADAAWTQAQAWMTSANQWRIGQNGLTSEAYAAFKKLNGYYLQDAEAASLMSDQQLATLKSLDALQDIIEKSGWSGSAYTKAAAQLQSAIESLRKDGFKVTTYEDYGATVGVGSVTKQVANAVGDAVSDSNSEWAAVLGPNGEVAYAFKKYLKEITAADGTKQYVVADTQIGLNLRDAASLSGKILTAVADGTVLGWRQVAGSSDGSGSGTGSSADDEAKAEADRQFKAWQTLQAALTAEGKRLSTLLTTQYGLQAVMNRRLGDPIDRIVERLGQIAFATGTTLNDKFSLVGAKIVEGIKNLPTPNPGASTPAGGQQQRPPVPNRTPVTATPATMDRPPRTGQTSVSAPPATVRPPRVVATQPAQIPSSATPMTSGDRSPRVMAATTPMVATTTVHSTTYVTIDTRSADAMRRIESLLDDVPTASVRVRGSVTRPPRNGR